MRHYNYFLKTLLVVFTLFVSSCSTDDSDLENSYFSSVDEFAATFDSDGTVSDDIKNQAFDFYNNEEWSSLELLFNEENLNGGWPPANGGFNIVDEVQIKTGNKYDRYGSSFGVDDKGNPILGGSFTSPFKRNGTTYTFSQRALRDAENTYDLYFTIEVIKDLPFTSQNADVIPWFNQPGLAKQAKWNIPIDDNSGFPKTWTTLAYEGYIIVTIVSSPSGKYPNFVGKVIKE